MKTSRILVVLALLFLVFNCDGATIKLYTDYPNTATPLGSDFLLFQRNGSYVNSAQSQFLASWFTSPNFTGTPTVTGNLVVSGIYYGNGIGITNINATGTNASFTYITNFTLFSTNISVQYLTNNTFITTNVTVEFPGGLTNLNLTPNSVMYSDANDAEASIPNAIGVLTNNGVGGIGFSSSLSLTEIDALNFYPTNLFTGLTNYPVLGTDGDGKLILGNNVTNLNVTNITVQTLYASTNFSTNFYSSTSFITNLYFQGGKGNTLIITNNLNLDYVSPSQFIVSDASKNLVSTLNGSTLTNLTYRYTTNAIPALTLTFGKAYTTNLSADITISAINAQDLAAYETCVLSLTNSSGSDFKVTLPNGIRGTPGSGTPPVFYCTNKFSCDVLISHYGNQNTNAWKIDWAP